MGRTEPHVPKTKSKVQRQTKYAEKRIDGLSPTLGEGAISEPRDFTLFCHFDLECSKKLGTLESYGCKHVQQWTEGCC